MRERIAARNDFIHIAKCRFQFVYLSEEATNLVAESIHQAIHQELCGICIRIFVCHRARVIESPQMHHLKLIFTG